MRIVTARRISQIFFFILFLWFCIVSTLGEAWWQLRGWPVGWLIQLDPLVGLGTLLATGTLYAGLLWGLLTVVLTIVLGRFFCGWLCPFGALHQAVGWLANRGHRTAAMIAANRYRRAQGIKYAILVFLLGAASGDLIGRLLRLSVGAPWVVVVIVAALLLVGTVVHFLRTISGVRWVTGVAVAAAVWLVLGFFTDGSRWLAASLQTGLLDPVPLFCRSVNLTLLPLVDGRLVSLSTTSRIYPGAVVMGALFWTTIFLNLAVPRFYCRFVCPLGALFGLLGKNALWRVGQRAKGCTACGACDRHCEGGCEPATVMRSAECVLCMNCMDSCRHDVMGYHPYPSAAGEVAVPDLNRREFVAALAAGLAAAPLARLEGMTGEAWNPAVIRPPGSLPETEFLQRCIKCGQCMRVCPTNVIHPAGLQAGVEGFWTPMLDFRMGTSGCQQGCIACGNLCPTAAIRPISLDERLGKGDFTSRGPIRIGMAFVDRGRCLPWAMDRPCIVCQENCPVSPKAIFTRETFRPVRLDGKLRFLGMTGSRLMVDGPALPAERFATGDYFISMGKRHGTPPARITEIGPGGLTLADTPPAETANRGDPVTLLVRLQLPYVDPAQCIGCGVCEHECPVKGRRAIRVTAENETRQRRHRLLL
ncbi:(4Fe-4S)-binding protein [Desulfosarcina alkanivorans]|uniref:(4Fe-4S)-binding protein n=1 Tax=Desulfosarcina alkanivorans TaxID=571177 RepID=A0A5K7YNK1_9BACT|nr:4Fe-4S binding protein [Desulfosarcina alkanivorans]BBO70786.1 (4Fe-4S)-binding protein [Desulfosarcina alkanivorans]